MYTDPVSSSLDTPRRDRVLLIVRRDLDTTRVHVIPAAGSEMVDRRKRGARVFRAVQGSGWRGCSAVAGGRGEGCGLVLRRAAGLVVEHA